MQTNTIERWKTLVRFQGQLLAAITSPLTPREATTIEAPCEAEFDRDETGDVAPMIAPCQSLLVLTKANVIRAKIVVVHNGCNDSTLDHLLIDGFALFPNDQALYQAFCARHNAHLEAVAHG